MDFLQYVFLEQPFVLIPLLVVGTYVCVVIWLRRRTRGAKRALLVALALCLLQPIVQKLAVTDRERIRAVCSAMVAAAKAGDVQELGVHVSEHFRGEDLDKTGLLAAAESAFVRYQLTDAELKSSKVSVAGERATVELDVSVTIAISEYAGVQPTTWVATFVREGDVWRLVAIQPRHTPLFPHDRLDELIP